MEPLLHTLAGAAQFRTTCWSMVYRAGADAPSAEERQRALEELCRAYWYPLYAYVRRHGHSPEDAQDVTQDFFSCLLENNALAEVHENKGRFRSFLLASFKNLLANEWKHSHRQKRGGGKVHFSLEHELAEGRYHQELLDPADPEKLYERQWVDTLLKRAIDRLRDEWESKDGARCFEDLKPFLVDKESVSFATVAARAGVTEASLKWAVHKLRGRYRELVREEIAHTVSSPDEVDDELRHLFSVLAG
jgi:RNA polymerase sigma factor (sigma-70 family)